MTIKLGAADLNYLLQQVNIGNDYAQFSSPLDPLGVREVSGENNNLVGGFTYNADGTVTWHSGTNLHSDWGQADTDFLRMFATDHPTNGTSYGFTFNPVTMQVIDSVRRYADRGCDRRPRGGSRRLHDPDDGVGRTGARHVAAHRDAAHHEFRR